MVCTDQIYYVYLHKRKDNQKIFYVGKGKGRRCKNKRERNSMWHNIVNLYGYTLVLYKINLTEAHALDIERKIISYLRNKGYELANIVDGGGGTCKKWQTEPKKQAIRDFYKQNGRLPTRTNERNLYKHIGAYCTPAGNSYDPDFHEEMKALGYGKNEKEQNKQAIRDFFQQNHRLPSTAIADEKKMRSYLAYYCKPAGNSYDPDFHEEMKALGYGKNEKEQNKQAIRDFFQQNHRFPSSVIADERKLNGALHRLCRISQYGYNPDFHEEMKALGYGKNEKEQNKQAIRDFYRQNHRFPSTKNNEAILNNYLRSYCGVSSTSYDPDFHEEMKGLGYGMKVLRKKQAIRDFYQQNHRFPSSIITDERKLNRALCSYCSKCCNTYDPDFHEEMKALGYGMKVSYKVQAIRNTK